MSKKFRRISIRDFSLGLALLMFIFFVLAFLLVFHDLEHIRTLACTTSREYLPRILARQQMFLNLERLRRNVSLAYHSRERREANRAGVTARALIGESVFDEATEFSALLEKLRPDFEKLLKLKSRLFEQEEDLHDREMMFVSSFARLTLRSGIQIERPLHGPLHSQDPHLLENSVCIHNNFEKVMKPLLEFCSHADSQEQADHDLLVDCDNFRENWKGIGDELGNLIALDAETRTLWQNIDRELREFSTYASTSEASHISQDMTHINEETNRITRLFLFSGALLLAGLAGMAILMHRHLLRPLVSTSRTLDAIRSGKKAPYLPPARILEVQNILDVLPGLARHMKELSLRSGQLKRERDQLADLSFRDGLTGIGNRRALENILNSDIPGTPLTLIMLDLDLFKSYNDIFGHQQGDVALKAVAQAVKQSLLRPSDAAYRYGGEEFTALLRDSSREGGLTVAQRIMDNIRSLALPHPASPTGFITVSIGMARRMDGDFTNVQKLLTLADQALYHSKKSGRNTITLSGEYEENTEAK